MNNKEKLNKIVELRNSNDYNRAIEFTEELLLDKQFRYSALLEGAMVHRAKGDLLKSNEMLSQAITEYADATWARIHLGVNLRYQNKIDNSINTLFAAVTNEPNNKYARYELCVSQIAYKSYDEASDQVEKVFQIDPYFDQMYWLGFIVALARKDTSLIIKFLNNYTGDELNKKIFEAVFKLTKNEDLLQEEDLHFIENNAKKIIQKINELIKLEVLSVDFIEKKPVKEPFQSDAKLSYIYQLIFESIEEKRSLSILRIGDGEGAINEYLNINNDDNRKIRAHKILCGADIWATWFGRLLSDESSESMKMLSFNLNESIKNATIVCPPLITKNLNLSYVSYHGCRVARDMCGISESKKYLNPIVSEDLFVETDFFDKLFSPNRVISLITCHPKLADYITTRGVVIKQNIIIPRQESNAKIFNYPFNNELHFIDAFPRVMNSINPDCDLFLVSAGVLGKIYCEQIRKLGGRSFDLGALADAFCGYNTRSSIWKKWNDKPLWKID
jgi:hypothetical protein